MGGREGDGGREVAARREQEGAKHAVVVNVLSHSDTGKEGERMEVEKSKREGEREGGNYTLGNMHNTVTLRH